MQIRKARTGIRSVGAKRIVLDTIESLFSGLANANILRAELRRLFRWLKDKGLTAVITARAAWRIRITSMISRSRTRDCASVTAGGE